MGIHPSRLQEGQHTEKPAIHIPWAEIEKFALSMHTFVEYLPAGPECMLELAAKFERPGNGSILTFLLQQKSSRRLDIETTNWTALHWAVECSQAVPVRCLLSNGAHSKREELQTALDIACSSCCQPRQ
jgi:hypothetical protein